MVFVNHKFDICKFKVFEDFIKKRNESDRSHEKQKNYSFDSFRKPKKLM